MLYFAKSKYFCIFVYGNRQKMKDCSPIVTGIETTSKQSSGSYDYHPCNC